MVRLLVVAGIGMAALVGLILIAWLVENRRGQSAWEQYRAELTGKGEKLELADLVPAPVPDSENFAATPLIVSMFSSGGGRKTSDPAAHEQATALGNPFPAKSGTKTPGGGSWETAVSIDLEGWQAFLEQHPRFRSDDSNRPTNAAAGILTALERFDSELNELSAAAARPSTVFPLRYEDNFNLRLPHLATLKGAVTLVRLRALARLQAGQTNEALQDVKLALRISQALKDEPLIISQLVRMAMLQLSLQPVWEGLLQRRWNDAQLAQLQATLVDISLLAGYGRCLRGERYFVNATLEQYRTGRLSTRDLDTSGIGVGPMFRLVPSGWLYQNQVSIARFYQEKMLPIIDLPQWRAHPDRAAVAESAPELIRRTPYNIMTTMLVPAVAKTPLKFAHRQATVDLAATACALERFYLAQGSYPEKLEALPAGLARGLHPDLMTGESFKYARTPDGRYTLYSVGWNLSDDQGEARHGRNNNTIEPSEGDWVWKYSP